MLMKFDRIQTFKSYPVHFTMSIKFFILAQLFVFSFAKTCDKPGQCISSIECNIVGVCIVSICFPCYLLLKSDQGGGAHWAKMGLIFMNCDVSKNGFLRISSNKESALR